MFIFIWIFSLFLELYINFWKLLKLISLALNILFGFINILIGVFKYQSYFRISPKILEA
jgi:hypothetical protein